MWDKVTKGICAALGAVAGFLGGWTPMLTILAAVMAVDYLTGLVIAALGMSPKTESGGLSSKAGFVGLAKKSFIIVIVFVATMLDKAIGNTAMVFQSMTTLYYIANESISILENASVLGVPFPEKIKEALEDMKQKSNKEKKDE